MAGLRRKRRSVCLVLLVLVLLLFGCPQQPERAHTPEGLRVVTRLGYCCIYNTCMYDACYSYGLPLFCRLACCWNYV
jgi:hypothetical protein